jgi:phosphoglucosamine mutase
MAIKEKIFGTDGVRGVANEYPMTVEMAMAIGQGVASVFKNHSSATR